MRLQNVMRWLGASDASEQEKRRSYMEIIESGDIPTLSETEALRRLLYHSARSEETGAVRESGEWTQHHVSGTNAEVFAEMQQRDTDNWGFFREVNAIRDRNLRKAEVQSDPIFGQIYRTYYILAALLLRHLKSIQYHRALDLDYMERQFQLMEQIIGNMETLVRHYGDYVQLLIMMPLQQYLRTEQDIEQLRATISAMQEVVRTVLGNDTQ